MATEQEITALAETTDSLKRIQTFDVEALPREQDLGTELNFREAIEPAKRLMGLYKQISISCLHDLPGQHLLRLTERC